MPVPKRKTSKARRDKRSANKHIRPQAVTTCQNCEQPLSSHAACAACGFYKGKKVLRTKIERVLARSEKKSAVSAKQKPAAAEHEGHGHEGHTHEEEK